MRGVHVTGGNDATEKLFLLLIEHSLRVNSQAYLIDKYDESLVSIVSRTFEHFVEDEFR